MEEKMLAYLQELVDNMKKRDEDGLQRFGKDAMREEIFHCCQMVSELLGKRVWVCGYELRVEEHRSIIDEILGKNK